MKRFSVRLFALGLALGALGAVTVLAAGAYARAPRTHTSTPRRAARHARTPESGRPVIDWNKFLLSIVNTPGAQPANIQPTRNFAIVHAAIYDAVNAIDRTHEPYLIAVRAPRNASETAAADAAAHTTLVGLYPAQQNSIDAEYASELASATRSRPTCSRSARTTARASRRRRSSRGPRRATTNRRRPTSQPPSSAPGGR
jgi:hypothetical protein